MDRKMVSKIQNINDGISAGSGIVSLAVPEFVATPLIVFAVNRILGLISDEDIIKLELQTGNPICYELDDDLKPINHYYLK